MNWDIDAERDLWRAICAPNTWYAQDGVTPATHPMSLEYFVRHVWGVESYLTKHPEEPQWFYPPIHSRYLSWLQKHILAWKDRSKRGSIERYYIGTVLPRGYGKTVTATKGAMLWCHLDEPDMSTLFCSSTSDLSRDILKAIKAVISGDDEDAQFTWLYGDWSRGAVKWTSDYIEDGYRRARNISEPSFDTTGIDSGMTGYHHRIHVWDDPITKNKMREGGVYLNAVHDAVNASYNALHMNGLLMFTLTRYEDDDVAGRHFREEGISSWEGMECPNSMMFDKVKMGEGSWHVFFYQTEDELTGEPTHPKLWTKRAIAEAKRRDPEDFACQQQNNPGTGERAPLVESQLPDLFMDYNEFYFQMQTLGLIDSASVHIDTAFKRKETIGKGDDNAIGVWLHDSRRNGMMYLDTDNLKASNEWREEDFNSQLLSVFLNLRKRQLRVKCLTDEVEPGGKSGSYKNRLLGILRAAGVRLKDDDFIQFNRSSDKRARIRTGTGNWAEGYVKVLLRKDKEGKWIIPSVVRKLFNQLLRVDVVKHDDLADCLTDGFAKGIWRGPTAHQNSPDEGAIPMQPGIESLQSFNRPLTNEEVFEMIEIQKEMNDTLGPGHGPDDGYGEPNEIGSWRING